VVKRARPGNGWSGRDINEKHRVSTPLELFFDLTFATSLAVVSQQMSRLLVHGDFFAALLSFAISMLSICWAWMNYSWFASAYDSDDLSFRLATMIHMVGVIVLSLGLPRLFQSTAEGVRLDNSVMVLGYVIMRLAMIFLWIRAAQFDHARRSTLLANAAVVFFAQVLWIILILWMPPLREALIYLAVLGCVEFVSPAAFYRSWGAPPWHAHHIAERYGLLVIIALGECVYGTVSMVGAVVDQRGWTAEPILVGTACVGLAFGCWWLYFQRSFGDFLKARRDSAYGWGYLHILVFASIVAMGAGLQVSGEFLKGKSVFTDLATLAFNAAAVCAYISSVFVVRNLSILRWSRIDLILWGGSMLAAVTSLAMLKWGFSLPACLAVLSLAPFVVISGREAFRLLGIKLSQ
jgi:low temperature requirement protein LtrA